MEDVIGSGNVNIQNRSESRRLKTLINSQTVTGLRSLYVCLRQQEAPQFSAVENIMCLVRV